MSWKKTFGRKICRRFFRYWMKNITVLLHRPVKLRSSPGQSSLGGNLFDIYVIVNRTHHVFTGGITAGFTVHYPVIVRKILRRLAENDTL